VEDKLKTVAHMSMPKVHTDVNPRTLRRHDWRGTDGVSELLVEISSRHYVAAVCRMQCATVVRSTQGRPVRCGDQQYERF
jgi:hypothetical protein